MSQLSKNVKRARQMTDLAARITKDAGEKLYADKASMDAMLTHYTAVNVKFATRTFELVGQLASLAKNPLGILVFLGGGFKDPWEEERESLKAYCRKFAALGQTVLTPEEKDLIDL